MARALRVVQLVVIAQLFEATLLLGPFAGRAAASEATPRRMAVEARTLPNGLRVWTQTTPGTSEAHVRLVVQAGSGDEPENGNGLAHFVEHMIFDHETDPGIHGLIQKIEREGGYYNAFTTVDMTYAVIDSFTGELEPSLELLASSLSGSPFTSDQVEVERQILLRELAEKEDDALMLAVREQLYGDQPLARAEGGVPDSIDRISARQLKAFYQQHYRPPALVLIVIGDLTTDEINAAVQRTLGKLTWSGHAPPAYGDPERNPGPIQVDDTDRSGTLLHGFVTPGARDPDYYALWVLQEQLEMRLYDRIRVHRGLSYAPYVYFSPNRREGLLYLDASANESDFGTMADAFDAELTRVASGELGADEVEEARLRVANRFVREHQSGEDLANHLAWLAGIIDPGEQPQDPVEPLKRVGRKDLKRVAERWSAAVFRVDARAPATPALPEPETAGRVPQAVLWSLSIGFALMLLLELLILRRMRALRQTLAASPNAQSK